MRCSEYDEANEFSLKWRTILQVSRINPRKNKKIHFLGPIHLTTSFCKKRLDLIQNTGPSIKESKTSWRRRRVSLTIARIELYTKEAKRCRSKEMEAHAQDYSCIEVRENMHTHHRKLYPELWPYQDADSVVNRLYLHYITIWKCWARAHIWITTSQRLKEGMRSHACCARYSCNFPTKQKVWPAHIVVLHRLHSSPLLDTWMRVLSACWLLVEVRP